MEFVQIVKFRTSKFDEMRKLAEGKPDEDEK